MVAMPKVNPCLGYSVFSRLAIPFNSLAETTPDKIPVFVDKAHFVLGIGQAVSRRLAEPFYTLHIFTTISAVEI